MKATLLSAGAAALLAVATWSVSANAAPIGSGFDALRSADGLVQRAYYDGDDWRYAHRRLWWWRLHHRDDDDRGWSWRHHHRFDRDGDRRHEWRDRDDRSDRDDRRWR
jgi:hypothetical protein